MSFRVEYQLKLTFSGPLAVRQRVPLPLASIPPCSATGESPCSMAALSGAISAIHKKTVVDMAGLLTEPHKHDWREAPKFQSDWKKPDEERVISAFGIDSPPPDRYLTVRTEIDAEKGCWREGLLSLRQLRAKSWLRFTRLARLIYPSFPEQNDERKIAPLHLITHEYSIEEFAEKREVNIPNLPGEEISRIIRHLLKAFALEPGKIDGILDHYPKLYDDRLFVSVVYGLARGSLTEQDQRRLFSLAVYVDRQEDTFSRLDGYAYTPAEINIHHAVKAPVYTYG